MIQIQPYIISSLVIFLSNYYIQSCISYTNPLLSQIILYRNRKTSFRITILTYHQVFIRKRKLLGDSIPFRPYFLLSSWNFPIAQTYYNTIFGHVLPKTSTKRITTYLHPPPHQNTAHISQIYSNKHKIYITRISNRDTTKETILPLLHRHQWMPYSIILKKLLHNRLL